MWTTTFKEQIPSISKSKVPRAAGENWQRTQTEFGFALHSLWFFTRRSQWHEMGLGDQKLVPLHVRNHFRYKPYKHCLYFCICDPHSAIFLPFPILSLLPYSVCWWAKPLSCLSSKEGIMLCHHFSYCSFLQQIFITIGKRSGSHHLCSLMTFGWLSSYYS